MNFQIISDVHAEMTKPEYVRNIERKAPILAVLGDVHPMSHPEALASTLRSLGENFDLVLFVPGNHEYYDSGYNMAETGRKMESMCDRLPNVVYMNEKDVEIMGVTFVGATMWTSPDPDADESAMNDFGHIKDFSIAKMISTHKRQVEHIRTAVERSKGMGNLGAVVMTHHAPSSDFIIPYGTRGTREYLPFYYADDVGDVLSDEHVKVWAHGHTHECYKVWRDNVLIGSNAVGYPGEPVNAVKKDVVFRFQEDQ